MGDGQNNPPAKDAQAVDQGSAAPHEPHSVANGAGHRQPHPAAANIGEPDSNPESSVTPSSRWLRARRGWCC